MHRLHETRPFALFVKNLMRADFYQLSRDSVEAALPALARAAMRSGERLLVVAEDAALRQRISEALWTRLPTAFLAHGEAGGAHDARQPILLSRTMPAGNGPAGNGPAGDGAAGDGPAGNGARLVAFADGVWREPDGDMRRAFLLFGQAELAGARATWRLLGTQGGVERRFWKQEGTGWVQGP